MPPKSVFGHCAELTDTPAQALLLWMKAERWLAVAEGRAEPEPDEVLPREVWHARENLDRQAA